jgi:hypothetical protein
MDAEGPGLRSRRTCKRIGHLLLTFDEMVRYTQLLDYITDEEIIPGRLEPVKVLVDNIAQFVTIKEYAPGEVVIAKGSLIRMPLFVLAGKVEMSKINTKKKTA